MQVALCHPLSPKVALAAGGRVPPSVASLERRLAVATYYICIGMIPGMCRDGVQAAATGTGSRAAASLRIVALMTAAMVHMAAAPNQAYVYWPVASRMAPAPSAAAAAPNWWAAKTQPNTTLPSEPKVLRQMAAVGGTEYFEVEVRQGQIVLTPVRIQRIDAIRAKLDRAGIGDSEIAEAVEWARSGAAPHHVGEP